MSEERKIPSWVEHASEHAMLAPKELGEWLNVPVHRLKVLRRDHGMPEPRFGSRRPRWRVGDIRAWLRQSSDLESELAKPIGDPDAKNTGASREEHERIMKSVRGDRAKYYRHRGH